MSTKGQAIPQIISGLARKCHRKEWRSSEGRSGGCMSPGNQCHGWTSSQFKLASSTEIHGCFQLYMDKREHANTQAVGCAYQNRAIYEIWLVYAHPRCNLFQVYRAARRCWRPAINVPIASSMITCSGQYPDCRQELMFYEVHLIHWVVHRCS